MPPAKDKRLGAGALDDVWRGDPKVELRIRFWGVLRDLCPKFFEDLLNLANPPRGAGLRLHALRKQWGLEAKNLDGWWIESDVLKFAAQSRRLGGPFPHLDALRPLFLRHARRLEELRNRYEWDKRRSLSRAISALIESARESPDSQASRTLLDLVERPETRRLIERLIERGVDPREHGHLESLLSLPGLPPPSRSNPWQFPDRPGDPNPLAPIEAVPTAEDADAFKARAAEHWRARTELAKRLGYRKSRAKNKGHLEILVHYQFRGEDPNDIRRKLGTPDYPDGNLSERSIESAIRRTSDALGLVLRKRKRGPRKGGPLSGAFRRPPIRSKQPY